MLCHQKLRYYCNIHVVIFERSLKNILPWILRFYRRTPDDDSFRSKHVAFRNNSKSVLSDGIICTCEEYVDIHYWTFWQRQMWKCCEFVKSLCCVWPEIWHFDMLHGVEIEYRWGQRFSAPVVTDHGAHPPSWTMGTGSFSRGKAAGTWC